jgi:hypothetical protein
MVNQNDLVKKTESKWPTQNDPIKKNMFSTTCANQVEHLSLLGCLLLVFQVKKVVNSCNVWH